MAVIRDTMAPFELFQPPTVDAAVGLLDRYGKDAWVLAGGLDSLDWFKDRIKKPAVVVDLGAIEGLKGVRELPDGSLEIGAMTTLTELARSAAIREKYGVLLQGAEIAASPQIRNQGTLGGNVAQDTRCWYYRSGWPCYRAGGNVCYADTPTAINREHAILDASRCVAVTPSDTAPALVALDAQMVVRSAGGERVIDAEEFFIGPKIDITRMTALEAGDLLTAIRIPATWAGARFYFEKVRDRQSWDFPLVNVASAARLSGQTIEDARVVVGAVAAHPVRLRAVEDLIRGQAVSDELLERAAAVAVQGARPLRWNGYKVPLMKNMVKRAIRGTEA